MTEQTYVEAACRSCDSTGIYCGFMEAKGTGVVCLTCDGTGCHKIYYKPFERRKRRNGVHTVSRSAGSFILTGTGAVGNSIPYKEFLAGKMPEAS